MSHAPLFIENLSLFFPQKICFEDFSATLYSGDRIGLIGPNGTGKSSLLKLFKGLLVPSEGRIKIPEGLEIGYVPQIIEEKETLSGGEQFNHALTQALSTHPDLLLLDEPTNHLDSRNRGSLMSLLRRFPGTLMIASHDPALLNTSVQRLWVFEGSKISVFKGTYSDYKTESSRHRTHLEENLEILTRQKKELHNSLMKEQTRAKKSRQQGEKHIDQRKWPTVVSKAKSRQAQETSGQKKQALTLHKEELSERLSELRLPEILKPKFSLKTSDIRDMLVISIQEGSCGYEAPVLTGISFSLSSRERIGIQGDNGSGKSTFLKALLNHPQVIKSGVWSTLKPAQIGYLDQHYKTLKPQKTVLEMLSEKRPDWTHSEMRSHLNDFLFRKNEEVSAYGSHLSGGERARLSLALIAAQTPAVLILDEITNNVDLETRTHLIQVLHLFPGALIVVSHDLAFLEALHLSHFYVIKEGSLRLD